MNPLITGPIVAPSDGVGIYNPIERPPCSGSEISSSIPPQMHILVLLQLQQENKLQEAIPCGWKTTSNIPDQKPDIYFMQNWLSVVNFVNGSKAVIPTADSLFHILHFDHFSLFIFSCIMAEICCKTRTNLKRRRKKSRGGCTTCK